MLKFCKLITPVLLSMSFCAMAGNHIAERDSYQRYLKAHEYELALDLLFTMIDKKKEWAKEEYNLWLSELIGFKNGDTYYKLSPEHTKEAMEIVLERVNRDAELDDADAQYILALKIFKSLDSYDDFDANIAEAVSLLTNAADQGHQASLILLSQMDKEKLESLGITLKSHDVQAPVAVPGSEQDVRIYRAIALGDKQKVERLLSQGIGNDSLKNSGAFAQAIKHNDTQLLDILIKYGANINAVNPFGQSVLMIAVESGDSSLVNYLIKNGANILYRNRKNNIHRGTALSVILNKFYGSEKEKLPIIRTLIYAGIDVDGGDGIDAAIVAVRFKDRKLLKTLIDRGIDLNDRSKHGSTVLGRAIENNDLELIAYLVKEGASLDIFEQEVSLLSYAISYNNHNIIDYFIDNVADINIRSSNDDTPLSKLLNKRIDTDIEKEKLLIIRTLIIAGADIDDDNKIEAAISAIRLKDRAMLKVIIEAGVDLNDQNSFGATVLGRAIKENDMEFITYLVSEGASPNIYEKKLPVLRLAIANKNYNAVKYLIKNGAKINVMYGSAPNKTTLLSFAFSRSSNEIILLLLSHGAELNYQPDLKGLWLLKGISRGDKKIIVALIKAGADLDDADVDGMTPLMCAAKGNYPDIFKIIHGAGANTNIIARYDRTALSIAIRKKDNEIINYLLEQKDYIEGLQGLIAIISAVQYGDLKLVARIRNKGAPVSGILSGGFGPLIAASYDIRIHILRYLLDEGADVNEKSITGETALMEAGSHGAKKSAISIIKYGGDVNAKSKSGLTPLMFAVDKGKYNYKLYRQMQTFNRSTMSWEWKLNLNLAEKIRLEKIRSKAEAEKKVKRLMSGSGSISGVVSCEDTKACSSVAMTPIAIVPGTTSSSISDWEKFENERYKGNTALVKLLIEYGAKINEQDYVFKRTALMQAVMNNDIEMVNLLLKLGARRNLRDKQGKTALILAKETQYVDIVSIIEQSNN